MTQKEFLTKVMETGIEELVTEAQARLDKMEAQTAARKEKSASKTSETNAPLLASLMEVLSVEPKTVAELNEAAELELSTQKIANLFKAGIAAGTIVKSSTKDAEGKKRVTYALADAQ